MVLRIEALREVAAVTRDDFLRDYRRQWLAERGLELAAQVVLDIGNHVLAGEFGESATEYEGIVKGLAARGVVSAALGKQLQGLGGFRNILVHGYLGIDPAKVFRIPIGIELAHFRPRTPESCRTVRAELGLPQDAFVVGSFQKDAVGWGEGREPKPIKGPDVLVRTLAELRERVPELHVLLSGPARGYVKEGLERHGVPCVHRLLDRYEGVARLYHALDAYLVPSRQEGGPKAVLESMASGVPLVSTRVGQAVDLVRDGENGWLVDVDDVAGLVERLAALATLDLSQVVAAGLATAAENSYDAQLPLWRSFFDGFVDA